MTGVQHLGLLVLASVPLMLLAGVLIEWRDARRRARRDARYLRAGLNPGNYRPHNPNVRGRA